jgi:hypothetical protein
MIQFLLIIIIAFLSHFIIDAFALSTYHPPQRENTNFWLYWHLFVYLSGLIIIISFPQFGLGMLFANLTDLWDWIILRNIAKKKKNPEWGKRFRLHPLANWIRKPLIGRLPDLTYNKVGILPESLLISAVLLYIIMQITFI